MQDYCLIQRIFFDATHFRKHFLRCSIVVSNQIGTGKVELLWRIFQDTLKCRYKLCQLDCLAYLILSNAKKFCDNFSGKELLAIIARSD